MVEDYPRTLMEWERCFQDERACAEYLARLRWPNGWMYLRCQGREACQVRRNRRRCGHCRYEISVTAGTIFQDSHLPLGTWFRAMWHVTNRKNGISALGLQQALGLSSYQTAWAILHELRRAMVRPGRDRLRGVVEVDETYWSGEEPGVAGRGAEDKALTIVAAQEEGKGIGRIRLRRIPGLTRARLHRFIAEAIEPGSTVRTDGLSAYLGLRGYVHECQVQCRQAAGAYLLPRIHRVVSLRKRWMLGPHQGAVGHEQLDAYLDEFTFWFNRRRSASRGKRFYRLAQQAVQVEPAPFPTLIKPQAVGGGGMK